MIMTPPQIQIFFLPYWLSFGRRPVLAAALCCLTAGQLSGQNPSIPSRQHKYLHGSVIDQSSKEKIASSSIFWKISGKGVLADSAGHFIIPITYRPDTLIVSHVGYTSETKRYDPDKDTGEVIIELRPKLAKDVVVLAKYSKGLMWWKKIVRHKPQNNPYQYPTYSCLLYKKLEMDLDNVTREGLGKVRLLRPFGFIADNIDSTSADKPFLPVFLKETLSQYYFSAHPLKKREEIKAIQTSGIKNEQILYFINGFSQQVNIYENYAILFGKEFISPVSNFGDNYYNYRAADTQMVQGVRYLHLFFTPKRQGENTFSGDCWIHGSSWAIREIHLDISSTANINYVNRLSITQEFRQQKDSTWIFKTDNFVAELSPVKNNKLSLLVRQTTSYEQVQVNPPGITAILSKNTETDQVLQEDSAKTRTAAYWQGNRPTPLSANEQKVYKMADTLKSIPLFKKYTNTVTFIFDGRKKLGLVEIGPWYKWMSANRLEKFRVRFDIATTELFSRYLRLHSYLAYGFGDHRLKGRMDLNYKFPGNGGYSAQAAYIKDLDNGNSLHNDEEVTTDNMFSQLIKRPGIKQKFIQVDEVRAGLTKEWPSKFSAQVFFSHTSYETFNPLPPKKMISMNQKDIINTELGIKLRYAPGEKIIAGFRKDRRIPGSNPVFEVKYAQGVPRLFRSVYQYQRLNASISQTIHIPRWGQVSYQVYGGRIFSGGALPFMLLELHPGNETYYYRRQAFNLMNRFEYFSDRYAGFSIEHNFEKKLLNLLPLLRKTNIRQFWNLKAVWGELCPASKKLNFGTEANYRMSSLQGKPYIELGTGLDNILTYFRVDLVWRFARPADFRRAPGSRPMAPPSNFGIFGSFHLQF